MMNNLPPHQRNDVAEDTIYNYDLTLFYFVFLHHTDLLRNNCKIATQFVDPVQEKYQC